jgi:hypothetical protein
VCDYDGLEDSDPMLAEFGLIEHESADYRDRTMQNVADADATLWIGEVGEKSIPTTLAIAEDLGARFTCNPTPAALRDWCRRTGIKVLHVAGECAGVDAPDIFNRAYELIGEAFGGGRGWIIHRRGDWHRPPFIGKECAIASVPPGKIYSNEDDAIADCFRLRQVGSGFEVGRIYLPRRLGQCSAPQ